MASYPPAVERYRATVAKYVPPSLVDKVLWTIQHESKGNPSAIGDGGVAVGLLQIQDSTRFKGRPTRAQLLNPEFNIRYAAQQLGMANGDFGAWGEGTTYKGKPFGAFGNNTYPGGRAMVSSNQLTQSTGGRAQTAPRPGNYQGDGGILGTDTGSQDPATFDDDTKVNLAQEILAAITAARPQASQFTLTDPSRPGAKVNADLLTYSEAMSAWMGGVSEAAQTATQLQQMSFGMATLPDGTVVPLSTLDPQTAAAVKASNSATFAKTYNDYATSRYNLANENIQQNFNNRLSLLNSSIALDDLPLKRAEVDINRTLNGLQEARSRANYVTDTQLKAAPYATQGGKTSFTASELGAGVAALARQGGIDPNAVMVNYPGYTTIDPSALLAEWDQRLGVNGQVPQVPQSLLSMGDLPAAPDLAPPPDLIDPTAVPAEGPTYSLPSGAVMPPVSDASAPSSSQLPPGQPPQNVTPRQRTVISPSGATLPAFLHPGDILKSGQQNR